MHYQAAIYYEQMHYIQKQILDQLRTTSQARYVQLQPDGIESSHFKYHLNLLITDGLVTHVDRGVYELSDKGKAYVDKLSSGRVNPHETPKVITYTLLQDSDSYYLLPKPKEPYRGLLNLVGGKLHVGEDALSASRRELREKLSIEGAGPKLKGVANIRIKNHDEPYTQVVAYVCTLTLDTQAPDQLVAISKPDINAQQNLAPDTLAIITKLQGNIPFVIDIDADISAG